MVKTHAQRQKEYQERKKAELGDKWLKAESSRTKRYHVPTAMLSKEKADSRRERVKKNVRRFRTKLRNQKNADKSQHERSDANQVNTISSSNEVSSSSDIQNPSTSNIQNPTTPKKLIVKLPGMATRNRVSRRVARQQREIRKLKDLSESLERKNASLRKKYSRLNQKCKSFAYSPRSKAEKDLRASGISPRKHPRIAHQLVFKNCLTEEIKASVV